MAKQTSVNLGITNNADGFDISGGTTKRKITVTGGDIALSSGGANTFTFPAATDTLVGRTSVDTLINKQITGDATYGVKNASLNTTAGEIGAAWLAYTPTGPTNTTLTGRYTVTGGTVTVAI